jgi:hypothetical protein
VLPKLVPRAQQARSYDEATQNSVLGWYLRNAQTRALSHPLPVMRAREIDRWAQSAQYKGLLARNRALGSSSNGGNGSSNGAAVAGGNGNGGSAAYQQVARGSTREIPII